MPEPKPVIGIIGGIGSGKSTVARAMADRGAVVLDADQIARELLKRPEIIRAARERWGEEVIAPDGQLNRARIAEIIFAPTDAGHAEKSYWEQLLHPLIAEALTRGVQEAQANPAARAVVIDAALLLEAGWDKACSVIVFVDAPPELRARRVAEQRGWSVTDLTDREKAQDSLTAKRRRADEVVDNSGSVNETVQQVERIFSRIISPAEPAVRRSLASDPN